MTTYTNNTNELVYIEFADGSSTFLMRGQTVETNKEAKFVHPGILVSVKEETPIKETSKKRFNR